MKTALLFLLMLCLNLNALRTQSINWLDQHPIEPGQDYYYAATYDNVGNVYNVGSKSLSSSSNCSGKILLTSFTSSGALIYSNAYSPLSNNGICDEIGNAIVHHSGSGKLIVGGQENRQAFLGYFDAGTGTFVNKVSVSTTGADSAIKGLYLSGNNVLAIGYFKNSITFGGSAPITLSGSINQNVFVAKFDLLGNVLQATRISASGTNAAIGFDIEEANNGDVYISVAANSSLSFNGTANYAISGSGFKILVFKLDGTLNFSTGTVISSSPYSILVDAEFPLELDQNSTSLVIGGVHQNQQQSFLTKLDITAATPTIDYQQQLNRVVRDLTVDCNNIYLTGHKGTAVLTRRVRRSLVPCSFSIFLFLDTHDLATGTQTGTKQATGCTQGEGIIVDDSDNIWINGYYGDPSNMTFESLSQNFSYNGQNGLVSKLLADSSCVVVSQYCCPGKNLVQNGDFAAGNVGFSNDYMNQPLVGVNSIVPGQYGVINGGQAATVSPTWSAIQDPTSCSNSSGNFLVINGENGGGPTPPQLSNSIPPTKIIWEQNFTVQDWRGYKFCFEAKNLDQCGFNVAPKIEVQFSMPFGNITQTVSTTVGACDWTDITTHLDLWGYGTSLNIKIILDQREFGDGNDVAIDNIALILLDKCPGASAELDVSSVTPHPTNSSYFSIVAVADIVPPCEAVWWEVCEYSFSTGDCVAGTKLNGVWWTATTNFPGYDGTSTPNGTTDPGLFEFGKIYRVTRGTWGECNSWISKAKYIGAASARAKIVTYSEEEFKTNKLKILKAFKGRKK